MESITEAITVENEGGVDRISKLPDSILAEILWYLPTKDAMATTFLSTRWKNVFPFGMKPLNLEFYEWDFLHTQDNESDDLSSSKFVDFVDKMLNVTLCDVPVNSMCLYSNKFGNSYGDAKIMSWVSAVLRLNVQQLNLSIALNEVETLFGCLKGCMTLNWLILSISCLERDSGLRLPDNFCLPKLKMLELLGMTIDDDDGYSINELIEGCPALELLRLENCTFGLSDELYIHSPVLKYLVIKDDRCGFINHLDLDAPNLERFTCSFNAPIIRHVSAFTSLSMADIDIELQYEPQSPTDRDGIANLVAACSSTIRLHLSAVTIDALHYSPLPLPAFRNLTDLALGSLGCRGWALLARMLLGAPNLENLTFKEAFNWKQGGFTHFESLLPSPPSCVELHIKSIKFQCFNGKEDEIKLLEYFLENAKVLTEAVIIYPSSMDFSILMRLITLSSHSKIVFVLR